MAESDDGVRLQINDRLQVTIKGTDEEVPTTYYSRVEDMKGQNYVISWPTSRGIRAPIHEESVLLLSFATENSVYCIESAIVERIRERLPLLTVRPLAPPTSVQRREYVRVPALVDVELTPRDAVKPGPEAIAVIRTRTFNLSGGGFAVHVTEPIQVGTFVDLRLRLPGAEEPLLLAAKVVRCEPSEDRSKGNYHEIGFAFVEIVESVRRKIISYVFRIQQSSLTRP